MRMLKFQKLKLKSNFTFPKNYDIIYIEDKEGEEKYMFKYVEGGDYDEKYGVTSCDFCGDSENDIYEYNGKDYCLDCLAEELAACFNPSLKQLSILYSSDMMDSVLSKLKKRFNNNKEKIQIILIGDSIVNEGLDWTIDFLRGSSNV